MKKTGLLFSVFILTLLFAGMVRAEVPSASTNKINGVKQKITDIKEKEAENKAKIKAEISSSTGKIKGLKQELKSSIEIRIGKKLDDQKTKFATVFENSIQNLKDLISRIDSRISKMVAENIDVSQSQTLLETAKTKLALAETELKNLENLLIADIPTASTSTSKNNRKTELKNIGLQSEKTKLSIKTAHSSIVEVVTSLKQGLMKKESTSTDQTVSTTTNNQ